jgi:predicted DNA-binding transcriptional regulator AlpA
MQTTLLQPAMLDISGAAQLAGISRRAAYELIGAGGFVPAIRLGPRTVRYRVADILRWVEAQPAGTTAGHEPSHLAASAKGRKRTSEKPQAKAGAGSASASAARPSDAHQSARGAA